MTTRQDLRPLPLSEALAAATGQRGAEVIITMCEGQWDVFLAGAYTAGAILLELDKDEQPVRAYQKAGST